jgi:hypothetical protein
MLRAEGGVVPTTYCTAQLNSQGCLPAISFAGQPSASSPQPFLIRAANVLGNVNGVLFYGTTGAAQVPFGGGVRCVNGPLRRTAILSSGGVGPFPNCTGQFSYDFNARIRSGVDPLLQQGTTVWAQFYSRDGGFAPPNNTNLTNAITFTIAP